MSFLVLIVTAALIPPLSPQGMKKIYSKRSSGGIASMHPQMLELWRLHPREGVEAPAEAPER